MTFKEAGKSYSRYMVKETRRLPRLTYDALNTAIGAGYDVKVMSPFHIHVRKSGLDRFYVNVWPTAHKIMEQYGYGASIYRDLLPALEDLFYEAESDREPLEPMSQEEKQLAEFRKNPLGTVEVDENDPF